MSFWSVGVAVAARSLGSDGERRTAPLPAGLSTRFPSPSRYGRSGEGYGQRPTARHRRSVGRGPVPRRGALQCRRRTAAAHRSPPYNGLFPSSVRWTFPSPAPIRLARPLPGAPAGLGEVKRPMVGRRRSVGRGPVPRQGVLQHRRRTAAAHRSPPYNGQRPTANGERRRSLRVCRPAFPLLRGTAAQERATANGQRLGAAGL